MTVLVAVLLATAASAAPVTSVNGTVIRVGDPPVELPAPCHALAAAWWGERLYIACGHEGLAVVRIATPPAVELLQMHIMDGKVVGFHQVDNTLWVEISRIEARPVIQTSAGEAAPVQVLQVQPGEAAVIAPAALPSVDAVAGSAAAPQPTDHISTPPHSARRVPQPDRFPPQVTNRREAATSPRTRSSRRARAIAAGREHRRLRGTSGHVIQVDDNGALVNLGGKHGIRVGDRMRLFNTVEHDLGGGAVVEAEEQLAVGKVTLVTTDRALVKLGVNELVPEGVSAQLTDRGTTARRMWRARPTGLWSAGISIRPFIGIGSFSGGVLADIAITYRFNSSIAIRLIIDPLGLGFGETQNTFVSSIVFSNGGSLYVTYNSTLFELGLGGGWSTLNVGGEHTYGLALSQYARIGTEDGLSLTLRNTFAVARLGFEHGSTSVSGQVGLSDKTWLTVAIGGFQAGYGYADAGLRILVAGNGGHGSWYLTPRIGGGGVWRASGIFVNQVFTGPLVGLSVEWRP